MQIRVTRQELGKLVGCSREIGRVPKMLEGDGYITVAGKTIVVLREPTGGSKPLKRARPLPSTQVSATAVA